MNDALLLLAGFAALDRALTGRVVARVLPVGRHGVHLSFDDEGPGLRLDTEPSGGAALLLRAAPPRQRGGRGAWDDTIARLDRDLAGRAVGSPRFSLRPLVLEVPLPGCAVLCLLLAAGRSTLQVEIAGSEPRAIPAGRWPAALPERLLAVEDLPRIAAAWRGALEGPGEGLAPRLSDAVPGVGRRGVQRLALRAARSGDPREGLATIAERLEGADLPAWVSGAQGGLAPARASHRDSLGVELVPDPAAAGEIELPTLAEALALWYDAASAAEGLARRRAAAVRLARHEIARADRALAAIERDEAKAEDAATLRRRADALLAAGPRATRTPSGAFEVPDPWEASPLLTIDADPRDPTPHAAAARLYACARREERGIGARRDRRRELGERRGALAEIAAREASADLEPQIAALERRLLALGIAAGDELERIASRGARGNEGGAARVLHSPSGFVVLAGRSAQQNDRLTFRTAAPEDLWFHVSGRPGAHVVLRSGGKPVPDADVRFAAGVAASLSRVPRGEAVDVTVARRKHLRRPRDGAPGEVLVRKGSTVRVRAGEEGSSPS